MLKAALQCLNLVAIFLLAWSAWSEPLTVTYRPAEDPADYRHFYEQYVLKIALDKTTEKYGPYELVKGPGMNLPRTFHSARKNSLENFFFKNSYSWEYTDELMYVPIPIDLGIVGYRVCFTSEALVESIARINHIDELRALTIGQGKSWNDADILRHNGFKVFEVLEYHNLFPMVAAGRFELFCRGANEVLKEWQEYKDEKSLAIDQSFALVYKLPRFFWTHKSNTAAAERIAEGLNIAYADGTLVALWEEFNLESVEFVKLHQRKLFWLENPQLKGITADYEKYFYYGKIEPGKPLTAKN